VKTEGDRGIAFLGDRLDRMGVFPGETFVVLNTFETYPVENDEARIVVLKGTILMCVHRGKPVPENRYTAAWAMCTFISSTGNIFQEMFVNASNLFVEFGRQRVEYVLSPL